MLNTPIYKLDENENKLYIKRDDLLPFSFGGNKARKAEKFFNEIDKGKYDSVVTYGSGSSNHGRIIANMAKARDLECIIISPEEASEETFNTEIMRYLGAKIIVTPAPYVAKTIDDLLLELNSKGRKPYFIQGGGHGNLGTQAYVDCYGEIKEYERKESINFDYIFLASGTGATQAGLVCGQLINADNRSIVGISIARKNPRGRDVILNSIKEYLESEHLEIDPSKIEQKTIFTDEYICGGYGKFNLEIERVIETSYKKYGLPLDPTYTGKAFSGMLSYVKDKGLIGKNILFIHTGGTPLYFDYLRGVSDVEND